MGLEILLTTVLPALLPALMDGVKMTISKLTGKEMAEPKSVDDLIKLREADIKHLKAMAELDKPYGEISKWVANFRSSSRYFAVSAIIGGYLLATLVFPENVSPERMIQLETLTQQALFFLIGDRAYLHIKQGK